MSGSATLDTDATLPIQVEYRITSRGMSPMRDDPGDPPEFEIDRVLICGAPVALCDLPALVQDAISEQIEMDIGSAVAADLADAAEYRRDAP